MSKDRLTEAIRQQLLAYLKAHPDASDTADGIGQWWLTERADAKALAAALHNLAECGVLECLHSADGRHRYRAAKRDR